MQNALFATMASQKQWTTDTLKLDGCQPIQRQEVQPSVEQMKQERNQHNFCAKTAMILVFVLSNARR